MARTRKILVVEDDPYLADAIVDVLTEGGYRVMYAREDDETIEVEPVEAAPEPLEPLEPISDLICGERQKPET